MTSYANNPEVNEDLAHQFGMSSQEYSECLKILQRKPNFTELGIFSVMWSEHCSYKSSKKWLKTLPTEAPWVICGPGENAGVVDIGEGQAAIFKMESHNHPSFIEPFQGAATGVGGILRDVFTMGARPVANLNSLRFGSPDNRRTKHLVRGVVAGIGGYGNCVGVPTVGGECTFHQRYNGNIIVNAMTVGIANINKIFYSKAIGAGNPVVYVGSKTGRDGIHGATMASASFGSDVETKRPTVQVGDPFTEKLLIEACLELMETNSIVAIQDMGAAGLTSSSFEMAGKGGLGIDLKLDSVPQREEGMSPYEIMLSESQERMLIVLHKGSEEKARQIFDKWELDFAIVGELTNSGRLKLTHNGETVADMPIAPLSDSSPEYDRKWTPPPKAGKVDTSNFDNHDPKGSLLKILSSADISSKKWIWEQYDHMVMADTILRPGGDSAIVRIHGSNRGLAITTDCTPRYCDADPFKGGVQCVAEVWRNLTSVGSTPLAITDCLNFGSPEIPEIMGQFIECIKGMTEACNDLNFPVVSGNVSFYNQTDGVAIQPTPQIGGVGLIENLDYIANISFSSDDQSLFLIGKTNGHLGASIFLREILGREDGEPPETDLEEEKRNGDFVRHLIKSGKVKTCHDVSDGGIYTAVAEMVLLSKRGIDLVLPELSTSNQFLFGEDQGRYIIAVDHKFAQSIISGATQSEVIITNIGKTGGNNLTVNKEWPISLEELVTANENWMQNYMNEIDPEGEL